MNHPMRRMGFTFVIIVNAERMYTSFTQDSTTSKKMFENVFLPLNSKTYRIVHASQYNVTFYLRHCKR